MNGSIITIYLSNVFTPLIEAYETVPYVAVVILGYKLSAER